MTSERKMEANRRNALLSTGPKTKEGKQASRLNALTHGFTAQLSESEQQRSPAFHDRRSKWGLEYRPRTDAAKFALDNAVAASLRIERCDREFNQLVADHAQRAQTAWDLDQREAVLVIAQRLAKNPMLVTARLKTSKHGCELLIEMWERLIEGLAKNGKFSSAETSTALDLLGLPVDLREGRTPLDPPDAATDLAAWLNQLIAKEMSKLQSYKTNGLDEIDRLDRRTASKGLGVEFTKSCQLLLRYERDANRLYREAIKEVGTTPQPVMRTPMKTDFDDMLEEPLPEPIRKPAAPAAVAPPPPVQASRNLRPDAALDNLMRGLVAGELSRSRSGTESISMLGSTR